MKVAASLPPTDAVREYSGHGEDDDGAEGRTRYVYRQEVGALVHRRPKRPENTKKCGKYMT